MASARRSLAVALAVIVVLIAGGGGGGRKTLYRGRAAVGWASSSQSKRRACVAGAPRRPRASATPGRR